MPKKKQTKTLPIVKLKNLNKTAATASSAINVKKNNKISGNQENIWRELEGSSPSSLSRNSSASSFSSTNSSSSIRRTKSYDTENKKQAPDKFENFTKKIKNKKIKTNEKSM